MKARTYSKTASSLELQVSTRHKAICVIPQVCHFRLNTLGMCIYIYIYCVYTPVGQNNGNTTDTVHISVLIRCCTTFCL
jgi:hypothetical protein